MVLLLLRLESHPFYPFKWNAVSLGWPSSTHLEKNDQALLEAGVKKTLFRLLGSGIHMCIAKRFDLLLKKHLLLLAMLKTVMLLNVFVEIMSFFINQDALINRKFKQKPFVHTYVNVFTVTFDQFNLSWLNKSINLYIKNKNIFEWYCNS